MSNLAIAQNNTNVVGLNNDTVYNHINDFLREKSKSTIKNYTGYYKEMFMHMCGKDIHLLTWDDILNIDYAKVKTYKLYLMDKGNSNNYINQKLFAGKKLWNTFFHITATYPPEQRVSKVVFDFEELEKDDNSYAALSLKELNMLYDYCLSLKSKPYTKYLYFKFLYIVACRKEIPLNLKWSDIERIEDTDTGKMIWVFNYYQKHQDTRKSISDEFYNELREYLDGNDLDYIFNITSQTIDKTMNDFLELNNLKYKNGRKVCVHSIKKTSCQTVQRTFKDLRITQKHAQHSDPSTTAKAYLDTDCYTQQPSFLLGKKYSIDMLKDLDDGMLLELIKQCGDEIIINQLCIKLEEIKSV